MTPQDNYRDREGHQQDFAQRKGFTDTMETPDAQRCLGCVLKSGATILAQPNYFAF